MVSYVELLSLTLSCDNMSLKTEDICLGLNLQNNQATDELDINVVSAIASDPLGVELLIYNKEDFSFYDKSFKVSRCQINHSLTNNDNLSFIVSYLIRVLATMCNNFKIESLKHQTKKRCNKKLVKTFNSKLLKKVIGSRCSLKMFNVEYIYKTLSNKLIVSFKIDIPSEGFIDFPFDILKYLSGIQVDTIFEYTEHDLSGVSIRTLFDERLEAYTKEHDTTANSLLNSQKEKIYPLVLYPFQEKTVSWMLQRELEPIAFAAKEDIEANPLKYLNEKQLGYISIMNDKYFYNTITNYCVSRKVAITNISRIENELEESLKNGNIKSGNGVLCEDMSLGKTIECIVTILLNRFSEHTISKYNVWQKTMLRENEELSQLINSTLVVCTDTILNQWISSFSEFSESLNFKIYHYKGFKEFQKEFKGMSPRDFSQKLHDYDIVITSYNTLVREVSFVDFANKRMANNDKTRNSKSLKYDYSSPLCLITFTRAIFDEVQSLSASSLSSISRIRKIHTWAVSATPLKSNNFDKCLVELKNLLCCLSIKPFNASNLKKITLKDVMDWRLRPLNNPPQEKLMCFAYPNKLVEELLDTLILRDISRRHSRNSVQHQLNIPKQHKRLIPVYLTPIERERYNQLYEKCLEDCRSGRYVITDIAKLNMYLNDLTMLCVEGLCVAHRGNQYEMQRNNETNNDDYEFSNSELNSMEAILSNMMLGNERTLNTLKKNVFSNYIDNARYLIEVLKKFEEAEMILTTVEQMVADELMECNKNQDERGEETSFRTTLLLLKHSIHFFLGNCYFQLGQMCFDEENKEKLALKENFEYESADKMRRLVLKSHIEEVTESMNILSDEALLNPPFLPFNDVIDLKIIEKSFYQKIENLYISSLENLVYDEAYSEDFSDQCAEQDDEFLARKKAHRQRNINTYENKIKPFLERINLVLHLFNKQWKLINSLYSENIELLKIPIVSDKNDSKLISEDTKNEDDAPITEYENGLTVQDKIFFNFELIHLILANRKFLLEDSFSTKGNKQFTIPDIFEEYKKDYFIIDSKNSWYEIQRAFLNLSFVQQTPILKMAMSIMETFHLSDDLKEHAKWNKRIQELNKIFNKKLSYYKSLQTISDKVMDLDFSAGVEKFAELHNKFEDKINNNNRQLKKLISRKKFLEGLSLIQKGEEMKCLICIDIIRHGSILECGHKFCKDCIRLWLKRKRVCALCNRSVNINEIHDFTIDFRPQKNDKKSIPIANNEPKGITSQNRSNKFFALHEYDLFPEMNKVEQFHIQSLNYGAKVETLIKSLSYIDIKDETSASLFGKQQIVIYSRFPKIIPLLAKILTDSGFKTLTAIDKKTKGKVIADFKKNRENRILILTNDSHAGLTLVNASILVLFDPILQCSVESQTINRISRIGQQRETLVLNFITMNTVEENIIRYKADLETQDFSTQFNVSDAAGTINKLTNQSARKRKSEEMMGGKKLQQMMLSSSFLEKCLFYKEEQNNT